MDLNTERSDERNARGRAINRKQSCRQKTELPLKGQQKAFFTFGSKFTVG
jgi:hypothetical protein